MNSPASDRASRASGPRSFVQLHLELDRDMSLMRAHEIADEVELRVLAQFPSAEVLIHQDPEGVEQPPVFPEAVRGGLRLGRR